MKKYLNFYERLLTIDFQRSEMLNLTLSIGLDKCLGLFHIAQIVVLCHLKYKIE